MIAARFHTPYLHQPRCEDLVMKRGRTAPPPIQKNGRQSRAHVPRENAPSGDIPLPTPSSARHSLESDSRRIHEAGNTARLITPPSRSFPPLSHCILSLPPPKSLANAHSSKLPSSHDGGNAPPNLPFKSRPFLLRRPHRPKRSPSFSPF